jgi:protein TonB
MATTETQKLELLARFSQKEFFSHGSKLSHSKLYQFIVIAFFLHILVVTFELIFHLNIKNPPAPLPIKVKYVDSHTPRPFKKKETLIDSLRSKSIQQKKTKPQESLIMSKHDTFEKKKYPEKKRYRKKKIAPSKTSNFPNTIQSLKTKTTKVKTKKKAAPLPSEFMGTQKTLSMLSGLNPEKYSSQDLQVKRREALDNDEPIPLDTKEEKYVSYFSRIKQQIQLAWIYPSQATTKKLIGEVTLKFEISRDGNLINLRLINTSGSNVLDMNAIKAVKEAAPYYPFPATISKKKLSILATFLYSAK